MSSCPAPAITCLQIMTEQLFPPAQQTIAITTTRSHNLQMVKVFHPVTWAGLLHFQIERVAAIIHYRVLLHQIRIA